jgi:peroxiredoxin
MNRDRLAKRLQTAALILLLPLGWLIWDSLQERLVGEGDRAPSFQVTTDRGKTITRSEFGGKVLVLNFWATWCPPCIDELPSLNAMAERMGPKGVVVLGVSVDKNEQAYKNFVQRARIQFETARDPDAGISGDYGTYKYPETYVISRDGKVVRKYVGPRDWMSSEVLRDLESQL